ncbi:hypothetical protein KY289_008430 [Solanum tuberosum]|nr:hypothetical protein KY289_008430 [Solanum tuberosum]
MKMWPETNNPRIEPPEPKQMSGRPPRNRRKSKDEPRKKYEKMSKQGVKITCSKCNQQGHNKKYCKVGVHTSQSASHNSQFTAGQSSQGSSHPEPTSSYQPGLTRFNQPASTTQAIMLHQQQFVVIPIQLRGLGKLQTSQPPPFVDTSIPVTRGITSQLPPRTRQTAGQKRERVATGEDSARGDQRGQLMVDQPGTSSQRILPTGSSYKDASLMGLDLGFNPRGLRWKNKDAITTSQLQQMGNKKKK